MRPLVLAVTCRRRNRRRPRGAGSGRRFLASRAVGGASSGKRKQLEVSSWFKGLRALCFWLLGSYNILYMFLFFHSKAVLYLLYVVQLTRDLILITC